jgi:3',5'-cyclic AMP phosphodiesterase CpdA
MGGEYPRRSENSAIPVDLSAAAGWTAEYRRENGIALTWLRREAPAARWALLADTHVSADAKAGSGEVKTSASASDVVRQVQGCGVAGTIINGDVAWLKGLVEDYAAAEGLLGPLADHGPLIALPGNHDRRENLCKVFSDPRMDEGAAKVVTVVDAGAVRLVCLDSLRRPDVVSGRLDPPQLAWLDDWLDAHAGKPVALFVHHPLDNPNSGLLDAPALLNVLRRHEHAKAVFTAHDHVFSHREQDGLLVVTQPAVGFPFEAAVMHGWLETELTAGGVSLTPWSIKDGPQETVRLTWLR